jgi:hypothetical protein
VTAVRRRGGDRGKAAATNTTDYGTAQRSADDNLPTVLASMFPPSGRRTIALLIVRTCPFCETGGHARRGHGVRQAGCGGGEYRLTARPA